MKMGARSSSERFYSANCVVYVGFADMSADVGAQRCL
jgi:hypothetical protein